MESRLSEIGALIEQIDPLVPKEGAKLRFQGPAEGNLTVGTQSGYLRLGIELLRAGLAPAAPEHEGQAPRLPLDVDYLLTADSDSPFELCEVNDDVERLPAPRKKLGALGELLATLAAVAVVGLLLVAAAAVVGWLFR